MLKEIDELLKIYGLEVEINDEQTKPEVTLTQIILKKNNEQIGFLTFYYVIGNKTIDIGYIKIYEQYQGKYYGFLLLFYSIEYCFDRYPITDNIILQDNSNRAGKSNSIYRAFGFTSSNTINRIMNAKNKRPLTRSFKNKYEHEESNKLILFKNVNPNLKNTPFNIHSWNEIKHDVFEILSHKLKEKLNTNQPPSRKRQRTGGSKKRNKKITKNNKNNKKK